MVLSPLFACVSWILHKRGPSRPRELTRIDKVRNIQTGVFQAIGGFVLAVTIAVLNVLAQAWIGQAFLEA